MKPLFILFTLITLSLTSFAHHVKGGYIRYEYAGAGSTAGTSLYTVTVTVFYGCGIPGPRASVTFAECINRCKCFIYHHFYNYISHGYQRNL